MTTDTTFSIKTMSPQFLVADIDRTIEFYTSKLGFEIRFRHEDFYCSLVKDGWSINIKLDDQVLAKEQRKNSDDLDLVFSVEGIDQLFEDIKAAPIKIIQPLREMPYGREFYIADPDDYRIGFIQSN